MKLKTSSGIVKIATTGNITEKLECIRQLAENREDYVRLNVGTPPLLKDINIHLLAKTSQDFGKVIDLADLSKSIKQREGTKKKI